MVQPEPLVTTTEVLVSDPTAHPPDGKKARNPRKLLGALRVILTLFTLLYHWRDDC